MPDFSVVYDSRWFWFAFGISAGVAVALWIIRIWPDECKETLSADSDNSRNQPHEIAVPRFVFLAQVATVLYGKLDDSKLQEQVNRKSKNDRNTMVELVGKILFNIVDIYGEKPPSSIRRRIEKAELAQLELWYFGAFALVEPGVRDIKQTVYQSLQVEETQAKRAIDEIVAMKDSAVLQIGEL